MFPETAKFNYFDARVARLRQTLFDIVQVENVRAASQNLKVNLQMSRNVRDLVVLAVLACILLVSSTQPSAVPAASVSCAIG